MTIYYEWDIETVDGEDIVDHHHEDKLEDLHFPTLAHDERLVLVRDDGTRLWAYVDESKMLPKYFSRPEADGNYHETNVKVPQRFHREIARVMRGGV